MRVTVLHRRVEFVQDCLVFCRCFGENYSFTILVGRFPMLDENSSNHHRLKIVELTLGTAKLASLRRTRRRRS